MEDFTIQDDFDMTDEDEEVLRKLRGGVAEESRKDPITGRSERKGSVLNKKQLSNHEMDEFFLDY